MASFPYIIQGIVYDTDGTTTLSNVRVTARNERTSQTISQNTNASGEYQLDLANLSNGYSNGDIITIYVIFTNLEDFIEHIVVESEGGATSQNLTLVEVPASDQLRYFTVQDYYDFFHLTAGAEDTPLTNEVVKVGVMVEEEIDRECSTRFSDGQMEIEVDDCDATTGWSGSTDAVAIAVTTDDADYKTRTGALDLGKSGTTQAFFTYEKTTMPSRDFRNRYLVCFVNLTSTTGLRTVDNGACVTIRYGSSSANYYERAWYLPDLIAGWNVLYFKIGDREVTTTGTITDSNMTYFRIRFDTVAATTTVTAGTYTMDNIFLTHQDHFIDEYMDTRSNWQWDYFTQKAPVDRLLYFIVNRADEGNAPSWDELTEYDNELVVDKGTGRIRLVDLSATQVTFTNILPTPGAQQARAVYLYGQTVVPKDIKKLAILLTAKDLMQGTVAKSLMKGIDSFKSDHYVVLDRQIENILMRYRRLDIINT